MVRTRTIIGILGLLIATGAGCLRRLELIEVHPDGSATLTARFEGDADDIRNGDTMPSTQAGWTVNTVEKKDGDKTKLIITATRTVAAGEVLPVTYAASDDAAKGRVLSFPTTITVEQRPDGRYYHFRRVYRARRWATYDFAYRTVFESDQVKKLTEKSPDELTDDERGALADAFIKAEAAKTLAFVDAALEPVRGEVAQDARLDIRAEVRAVFDDPKLRKHALALLAKNEQSTDADNIEAQLQSDIVEALTTAAKRHGLDEKTIARCRATHLAARADHEISEDLGDEAWAVAVKLPGRIVAHNATDAETLPLPANQAAENPEPFKVDAVADEFKRGVDRCGWSFEGKALYDRDIVLMATSFVAKND